ncbi:MAG: hypothetical protein OXC40_06485 [Proteobacteria bacterium]|nr:hypothetical protein [Pseudomonadota bacterium]
MLFQRNNNSSWAAHKRALVVCFLVLLAISLPYGFLVYLHSKRHPHHLSLQAPVPGFVWSVTGVSSTSQNDHDSQDKNLQYLTHQSLYGAVTVVYYLSDRCGCDEAIRTMNQLAKSLDQKFTVREHFEESDLFFQGALVTAHPSASRYLHDLDLQHRTKAGVWYLVNQDVQDDLTKLWQLSSLNKVMVGELPDALVLIFDSRSLLRGVVSESQLRTGELAQILSLVSLVHFQSSTHEYLRERTFFGAKKTAQKQKNKP